MCRAGGLPRKGTRQGEADESFVVEVGGSCVYDIFSEPGEVGVRGVRECGVEFPGFDVRCVLLEEIGGEVASSCAEFKDGILMKG